MRLRHPREWRSAYASWLAGARKPTRAEARWYFVSWAVLSLGFGGGAWWEPVTGFFLVGWGGLAYLAFWRLRTGQATFHPQWQRDAAERTGWPPALVVRGIEVLFAAAFASGVLSWLR